MADFMRIKYENPRLKQSEIADRLNCSSSTLQSYRNGLNMLSPYRIQSNNTNKRTKKPSITNSDIDSHVNHDVKRPQLTSNDLKRPQSTSKTKSKNVLKGGSVQDYIDINEHSLDKILNINNS